MAQTSSLPAQTANTISVVNPNFLSPYPMDLIIKKLWSLSGGNFVVTDVNSNIMFKVKGKFISLHDRRVLLDVAGTPILSFQKKLVSFHNRWVVFKGDGSNSKDMIFSAKRSSTLQFKTSLHVFLANNKEENVCDFKVKGSWFERSCTIYAANGTTIIAQLTSARKRWQCFRGESTNPRDHLFSAKQVNRTQFKTSLDVYLASNRNQDVADFTVRGNWFEKRCTIYAGESTTAIAEMNRKQTVQFMAFGVDSYTITIYPNVDYVFVVALVAILNEINDDKDDDEK